MEEEKTIQNPHEEKPVQYCQCYYCGKKAIKDNQNLSDRKHSPPMLSARTSHNNTSYIRRGKIMLGKTFQTITRLMALGIIIPSLLLVSSIPVARAATDFFGYTWGGSAEYSFNAGAGDISVAGATYYLPSETQFLCGLTIPLKTHGSPTGTMTFSLRYSGGTPENGALLYSATLDIATLTSSYTNWSITVNNGYGCQELTSGNVFYFTITTDQAVSNPAVNYVVGKSVAYNNSPDYPNVKGFYKGAISGWSAGASLTTPIILTSGYDSGGNAFGTSVFPTSTLNFSGIASSTVNCNSGSGFFSSSTISDLGCHFNQALQNFGVFMLKPATSSVEYFNGSISSFDTVFPFSIFFNFTGLVENLAGNYTATDNTITVILPTSTIMKSTTFSFSSSTLNVYLGTSNWSLIREYESYAIWIITLIGILATVGVLKRKKK